jgi:hypothetical protein
MPRFVFPPPARQVYVHGLLAKSRGAVLQDAVRAACQDITPSTLLAEMQRYVPENGLKKLQGTDVRDEMVFATPSVLSSKPTTLGYYRLLLGISQKRFYGNGTGLAVFKCMEDRGALRGHLASQLPDLCTEMNAAMTALLDELPAESLSMDVAQLPLMMLGAQADGSWRTRIGQLATKDVYEALKNVIKESGYKHYESSHSLTVVNSANRVVTLALAPDPDMEIRESVNDTEFLKVAIEIKGGTDLSNAHNRAGEAEKSHQKAKLRSARDFWTIMSTTGLSMSTLQSESPTTNSWFDIEQVLAGAGKDWDRLVSQIMLAMGI